MKKLIILLLLLMKWNINSQEIDIPNSINIPISMLNTSPEVSSLHRVNFLPMNLYTGKIDIEIPIYTIKSGDVEIPISLRYDMHGNKVDNKASNIGWGWVLQAGGNITRIVRDIKDHDYKEFIEKVNCSGGIGCNDIGIEVKGVKLISKGYLADIKQIKDYNYYTSNLNEDAQPDLFLVSAPGLSTKFYLEKNNKVYNAINIGNQTIKIKSPIYNSFDVEGIKDYAGFLSEDVFPFIHDNQVHTILELFRGNSKYNGLIRNYNKDYDHFKIVNDRGIEYQFSSYDISESVKAYLELLNESYVGHPGYGVPHWESVYDSYNIEKSAWHLDRIVDSNNREIRYIYEPVYTFEYDKRKSIYIDYYAPDKNEINKVFNSLDKGAFYDLMNIDPFFVKNSDFTESVNTLYSKIKRDADKDDLIIDDFSKTTQSQNLKKIIWDEGEVIFIYDKERNDNPGSQRLSRIEVIDKQGNIIKRMELKHSYFISGQDRYSDGQSDNRLYRLKLDEVVDYYTSDKYSFEYHNPNDIPMLYSYDKDFLGYYNKKNNILKLFTDGFSNDFVVFRPKFMFIPNQERFSIAPFQNNSFFDKAIISTGENNMNANKYSLNGLLNKIIYPTGGSIEIEYENNIFSFNGEDVISGGGRIKTQIISDKDGKKIIKKYEYIDKDGNSSGRIGNFPKIADIYVWNSEKKELVFSTYEYSKSDIELTQGAYVGYSRVLERIEGKNGFTEYNYNSFDEYPNEYEEHDYSFFSKHSFYPGIAYTDHDNRRGTISSKIVFSSPTKKLLEEYYYYDNYKVISSKKNTFRKSSLIQDRISGLNLYKEEYSIKNINSINRISSKKTIEYYNNIYNTEEKYFYDSQIHDYLTRIEKQSNDKEVMKYIYSYPFEKNNQFLIKKNILKTPLDVTFIKNDNIISREEIKYPTSQLEANQKTNGLPLPISVLSSDLETPSKVKEDIIYTGYDDKGNLLEYRMNGITPVSIVWGYKKTLPIAKIEGAFYREISQYIENIISKSNQDIDSFSEKQLLTELDRFREVPELQKYQITTYTHNPLIGVTSITSPSGVRESYVYDEFNRLKQILDKDGNILKEYEYHYADKNIDVSLGTIYKNKEISKTFSKDNCPTNADPIVYTYIVPAGKYVSMISQQDADQKALDDIEKNGQQKANENGDCIMTYYNQEKHTHFFKNNCPDGYTSNGTYNYVVQQGKYSSKISQEEADNKAQEEIIALGQIQANHNLTCIPNSCRITPIQNEYYKLPENIHIRIDNNRIQLSSLPEIINPNWFFIGHRKHVLIGQLENSCIPKAYLYQHIDDGIFWWNIRINTSGEVWLMRQHAYREFSSNGIEENVSSEFISN